MLAHRCKMQDRVALSSGEAELKASCKCVAEMLETREVVQFLTGMEAALALHLDATATQGMLHRQGAGKLKHLSVRTLWVQGAVQEARIRVVKIPRALNHADALCSFHSVPEFHAKMAAMGLRVTARAGPRRGGKVDTMQNKSKARLRTQQEVRSRGDVLESGDSWR